MKSVAQVEHRASSSRSKHEGESSFGLCDRLSRTRDNSQRQLPTDQDYAVSTREYQTDQSSLHTAPTAARSVLEKRRNQRQQRPYCCAELTRSLHIRPSHSLRRFCLRFPPSSGRLVGNPYLGITSGLPITRQESCDGPEKHYPKPICKYWPVGSRTGAVFRRSGLAGCSPFPLGVPQ
jgi:hypothetical protein